MPDIARDPAILKRKRLRQAILAVAAVLVLVVLSAALARMEPAAPSVERATVLEDTVKRGSIIRQVRGVGTLVPEDTRWLPATTEGRVERILLRPGATVAADSVILVLSNPQVEQEALNARLALQSARAGLDNLRAQLQNDLLTQQSQAATIQSDFEQARMEAEANEALAKEQLVSELIRRQSHLKAETLKNRVEIETRRLTASRESIEARLRVQQATVDQAQAMTDLYASRLRALQVTPGFAGVLQQVPVDVGQRVAPGQNLARVADPGRLKAELKVAETEARDIEVGQSAEIDTRSGKIAGRVSRKDPGAANGTVTIDVSLTDELPRGAVPDLSVDGTVQLEHLENVLYVGRPSLGQDNSTAGLFKVTNPDGTAMRVQVKFGTSSVNEIVVVSGLKEGDRVVLSDMSAWDAYDRVRLR
ncbi:MAG TPA: HlyD family efflux transporter periplasmic adaptor subunit [Vicinamibacterales bacterium]|nr:HlyD family efflux transporter periplasmic adaptor subunit [Vicinamibacterales bacterium]HXR45678.1 HlyD family efflux transporter periplasmic adaptor subunit [Pseudolysinimonas sp.]